MRHLNKLLWGFGCTIFNIARPWSRQPHRWCKATNTDTYTRPHRWIGKGVACGVKGLVGVPTTVAWHFEFNEIYAIFLICQMHCGICSSPAASATRQSAMHQAGGFAPRKGLTRDARGIKGGEVLRYRHYWQLGCRCTARKKRFKSALSE